MASNKTDTGCYCGKAGVGTRHPSPTTRRYDVDIYHPISSRTCQATVWWDQERRGYVMGPRGVENPPWPPWKGQM